MNYTDFLQSKRHKVEKSGLEPHDLHPSLFPFQRDIVSWAVRLGRAAIFADCGLGKSRMQLEWIRHFGPRGLIVAPIGVQEQTIVEGASIGVSVRRLLEPDNDDGIGITNYERLHKFTSQNYDAIVLDESSILKSIDGKTRTLLLHEFAPRIPRRLCCTATPAPNDISELANHAEFVGVMSRPEMLATFFVHDDDGWRVKGHARDALWRWLSKWAVYIRKPSDLGYADAGFSLPPLNISDVSVPSGLGAAALGGVGARFKIRRSTMDARVSDAVRIILNDVDRHQWVVWCGLNDEGGELACRLGGSAVLVEGSDPERTKLDREVAWRTGQTRVLITKPSIFGFGMNWQHCHKMLFLGLGDSYEEYYQAIRRCWRFGQKSPVDVHIVISDIEGAVAENVRRKEQDAETVASAVMAEIKETQMAELVQNTRHVDVYTTKDDRSDRHWLMLGDSMERVKEIQSGTVGLSVFSPPFATLYTYSATHRDLGNCRDYDQFFEHFKFLVPELLRVTMPGRRCAVHVAQVSTLKGLHGVIGWRDFRSDVVRAFIAGGWVYDGEVVIDKDPQAQAIRTKSKQLMFVQKERDSSWLRPAMADYILCFRHPGENKIPVKSDVTNEEWIMFARPIWYGIRESNTLRTASARMDEDEKHICPLQLETIDRCVRLWSNPRECVLSPFAGIGSEGYVALKRGRNFIGIELKDSYYQVGVQNIRVALQDSDITWEVADAAKEIQARKAKKNTTSSLQQPLPTLRAR